MFTHLYYFNPNVHKYQYYNNNKLYIVCQIQFKYLICEITITKIMYVKKIVCKK